MSWGITDWACLTTLIILVLGFWVLVISFLLQQGKKSKDKPHPPKPQKSETAITPQKDLDSEKYDKERQALEVKCLKCSGHYVFRRGKNGPFAGCSNYRANGCRSTLSIQEFVRQLLRKFGVNIYAWKKECCSCGGMTTVYSYYLVHDFKKHIPDLEAVPEIGIGDIPTLDFLVAKQFPNIERSSSRVMGTIYWANRCERCHALQGKNYVVAEPDNECVRDILENDEDLSPYLVKTLKLSVQESNVIECIVAAICSFL